MRDPKKHPAPRDHAFKLPQVSSAKGLSLTTYSVAALPLINHFIKRLRIRELLEVYLPVKDRRARISPALGICTLLRNSLLAREPIYGVGEWAGAYAPDLLDLEPDQVVHLNDDRVGRCLDRLFDADRTSLLLAAVDHAVREFEVGLDQLHNDSTTVTFAGRYESASVPKLRRGKTTLAILHGHNKDHRPDLKQLLFILTVTDDGAVPIHFSAADGNVTDDKTHIRTWDLLCKLTGRTDFLYVADCKLASAENMGHIEEGKGRFLTVLPRSRAEVHSFYKHIQDHQLGWTEIYRRKDEHGNVLDVFSVADLKTVTAEGYRLVWYFSTAKQERDRESRQRCLQATIDGLMDLREKLRSPKTRYRRRAPVQEVVDQILNANDTSRYFKVEVKEIVEEQIKQEGPGRPGKDTRYLKRTRSRFDLAYEIDQEPIRRDAKADGTFPLVTNDCRLTDRELLLAYKEQVRVEQRHHHLKGVHEVAPVFLKDVSRIEALLCVYFFVLLIHALIERELRLGMMAEGIEDLPLYPEGRACKAPSTTRVLEIFEHLQRHHLSEGGAPKAVMASRLSALHKQILALLHVPASAYAF